MDIKKRQKNAEIFICEKCNFKCSKHSDWERHIIRPKHKKNINNIKKTPKNMINCDYCGKIYKYYSGLWKHNQICNNNLTNNIIINDKNNINNINNINNDENPELNKLTTLMIEMIKTHNETQKQNNETQKQNNEMQKQIIEVCKTNNTNNIITNNTMTNSNNKTFNLQVFLNEQCKDAMNLSDFMESIQLNLTDLENMDKLGYVECMFKNIFGHMDFISIFSRPFHCSDFKRGIIYIKENGVWEKEDMGHSRLINAIRTVEKKNFKLLKEWSEKYPSFSDYNSPHNDKYLKIYSETMNGDKHNLSKLIRKLSKSCVIDKSKL